MSRKVLFYKGKLYFSADTVYVPTKLSQLQNDVGYITSASIPTNVSAFTNDAGYLTSHQDISGKVNKAGDTMTGNLTVNGSNIVLGTSSTSSNDSGDLLWTYGDGQEKMRIWTDNEPTTAVGPNYRIYKSDGTSLYSGRLATVAELINTTYNFSSSDNSIAFNGSAVGTVVSIDGVVKAFKTADIGSGATTHANALKTYFDNNKTTVPRNKLSTFYSNAYSNGSQYFGYFLNGYDTTPYGGFYVAHYNNPYYVGIQSGTYTQYALAHNANVGSGDSNGQIKIAGTNVSVKGLNTAAYKASTYFARISVQGWGTTLSFTPTSWNMPCMVTIFSNVLVIFGNGSITGTHYLNIRAIANNKYKDKGGTGTVSISYTAAELDLTIGATISQNTSGTITITATGNTQMTAFYY